MEMDGWMGPLKTSLHEYWRKKSISIRICLVILLFVPGFRGFFSDTRVMWNEEMKAGDRSISLHDEIVIYLLGQGTSESIPSPQQCYLLS